MQATRRHATGTAADSCAISVAMLRLTIEGRTYQEVAAEFGVTRTAVERRVKAVAVRLSREVGVEGLNENAAGFVKRLRGHRDAVLQALEHFVPIDKPVPKAEHVLTLDETARAAARIRTRSAHPSRDVALFCMLFVTGARPLEIARLRVADYLGEDGQVRRESELPAESSITGKARPLYFGSRNLDDALDGYLAERLRLRHGVGDPALYRGLEPTSPLFLTASGDAFRITQYGSAGQRRFLCRPILETYRKLFRQAQLEGMTPLSVRRTVVAWLYERGADEEQIGLALGIGDRSAVRELYSRVRPTFTKLFEDLV